MRDRLKKIFTLYSVLGFLLAAALPLVADAVFVLTGLLTLLSVVFWRHPSLVYAVNLLAVVVLPLVAGWLFAAKARLPRTLFARLLPLLLPPLLLSLPSPFYALTGSPLFRDSLSRMLIITGIIYCSFCLAFLIRSERRGRSAAKKRGMAWLLGVALVCAGSAIVAYQIATRDIVRSGDEAFVEHEHLLDIWHYWPFRGNELLAQPASPPSLHIASDYPRLVGCKDLVPLYGAIAQAVYTGLGQNSHGIIDESCDVKNLVDGKADIFFGKKVSRQGRDYAASNGLTLTEIPIGHEAFVFFTHKDNPVRSLTQAQIRAVYSGRIRNWKELGGRDEPILAFQRIKGSDAQDTMLGIMNGEAMAPPPRAQQQGASGANYTVINVAAYHNRKNALGYSCRWYTTVPNASPGIRLLAVDGILPTPENIQSGAYPFTTLLLAVTARPLSPQSRSLLNWIIGPEGQDLIARTGYVPLRPGAYQDEIDRLAEQKGADIQFTLGEMYFLGRDVPKDEYKGAVWIQKAAERGYARAQYMLGRLYESGRGVEKDDHKALEWYQKAAEQGYDTAQFYLGLAYEYGAIGAAKDKNKAVEWYQKAAKQGNESAKEAMNRLKE